MKDPMKLAQCILQCKFLKHSITFIQETHVWNKYTQVQRKSRAEWMGIYILWVKN